ncbi:hypothetical protein KC867_01100, partial [Candidatus Saccharibacteria bacterium]|nr:hypothetical protein [Candidatus Saccharibacteria bacterium]
VGQASLPLQFNYSASVCDSNVNGAGGIQDKSMIMSRTHIEQVTAVVRPHGGGASVGGISVSGVSASYMDMVPAGVGGCAYVNEWRWLNNCATGVSGGLPTNVRYNIDGLGGLTPGQTYVIETTVRTRPVNWFYWNSTGISLLRCVGQTGGGTYIDTTQIEGYNCPTVTVTRNFIITVPNPNAHLPTGNATATCSTITGSVIDLDRPTQTLRLAVYVDRGQYDPSPGIRIPDSPGGAYMTQGGVTGGFVINDVRYTSYNDAAPRTFYVYAFNVDNNGNPAGVNPLVATVTRPVCPPSCTTSVTPGFLLPGDIFTFTVTVSDSRGAQGRPMGNYTIYTTTGPPLGALSPSSISGNLTTTSFNSHYFTGTAPNLAGRYNVNTTIRYDSGTITRTCNMSGGTVPNNPGDDDTPVNVTAQPYLKSYGGDVVVGGTFQDSNATCTAINTSGSNSTNKLYQINANASTNASGQHIGSSAQLTVSALLQVNGFYSNSQNAGTNAKSLTIANAERTSGSNTMATSTYGGGSGNSRCVTDYFGTTRDSGITATTMLDALSGGRKQYYQAGDATIPGGTINTGSQVAIYIDGDVFIQDQLTFATGATSREAMPNLYIIAKGNIYVSSSVTNLDGTYIAQPRTNGTGGVIYTCATGSVTAPVIPAVANRHSNCSNKLTVNGGLIAKEVKFLRTAGHITKSTPSAEPVSSNGAAEVINYTPEVYIAPSPLKRPGTSSIVDPASSGFSGKYDYIRSMPPIY